VIREAAAIAFADPFEIFDADGQILPIEEMSERCASSGLVTN
jgi:hypothetical protein